MSVQEERVEFPPGLYRFASLEAFYSADEARRFSGEADYGIYWWDGPQGHSDTWRISAVAETGEVYALRAQSYRRDRTDANVVLLGKVSDDPAAPADTAYAFADRVLEGWNLVCGKSSSLRWAIDRVLAATGEWPAPLSILCRHQTLGGHVHVDVFVGRVAGSRGKAGELVMQEEEWKVFLAGLQSGFGDRLELTERAATG